MGIVDKPEQQMTAEERAAVAQVSETLEVRKGGLVHATGVHS